MSGGTISELEITKKGQNFSFVYVQIDVHQTLRQNAMEADRYGETGVQGRNWGKSYAFGNQHVDAI